MLCEASVPSLLLFLVWLICRHASRLYFGFFEKISPNLTLSLPWLVVPSPFLNVYALLDFMNGLNLLFSQQLERKSTRYSRHQRWFTRANLILLGENLSKSEIQQLDQSYKFPDWSSFSKGPMWLCVSSPTSDKSGIWSSDFHPALPL